MTLPATNWFLKCAITAVVMVGTCAMATTRLGTQRQLALTTRAANIDALERYVGQTMAEVVLVGSSLTYHLSESYFSTPHVRNLALSGGSPVTGLEIVAARRPLPKIILVEMNVLSRRTDQDLVDRFSGRSSPLLFRPIRAAVAAYENWLHEPASPAQTASAIDRLIKSPPQDFDNRAYLEEALRRQANEGLEDQESITRENVDEIRKLVASIEQRGSNVLLFELPYTDRMEASRLARMTRDVVHAAFPNPRSWLTFDAHREELRWPDGVHLDQRSAVIVARSMNRSIQEVVQSH